MSLPSVDEQREPAQMVGLGHDHPFGAAFGDDQVGADRVGVVVDPRDHPRQHVLDVAAELEPGLLWQRRQHAEEGGKGRQQWQHLVPLGLGPEQLLELGDLVRVLGGQVVRLAVIVGQVVQLGRVGVGVPDTGRVGLEGSGVRTHGMRGGPHRQPPAVLVHRPVADGLEVLLGVPLGRRRVGERAGETHAVHRLLLDPVHRRRDRDARDVQDGRRDVDDVRELRAERARAGDARRPVDDHRVARAAQVRAHLLAPLERGVAGPRPRRASSADP